MKVSYILSYVTGNFRSFGFHLGSFVGHMRSIERHLNVIGGHVKVISSHLHVSDKVKVKLTIKFCLRFTEVKLKSVEGLLKVM